VVLQHGAVLADRLPFDETDLVTGLADDEREVARARLRATTVTLAELAAPTDPRTVAAALVDGFSTTLDVKFRVTAFAEAAATAGSTSAARRENAPRATG
jgi:hypothetical protein